MRTPRANKKRKQDVEEVGNSFLRKLKALRARHDKLEGRIKFLEAAFKKMTEEEQPQKKLTGGR